MTIQQPYTYTILRYVHDVTTGEFVNVGVVMHLPREGRLLAKARTPLGGCGEYVLIWTERPLLLRCVLHNALSTE